MTDDKKTPDEIKVFEQEDAFGKPDRFWEPQGSCSFSGGTRYIKPPERIEGLRVAINDADRESKEGRDIGWLTHHNKAIILKAARAYLALYEPKKTIAIPSPDGLKSVEVEG